MKALLATQVSASTHPWGAVAWPLSSAAPESQHKTAGIFAIQRPLLRAVYCAVLRMHLLLAGRPARGLLKTARHLGEASRDV